MQDNYVRTARVDLSQYFDGDTFDCYLDLGCNVTKRERVRLAGINTPEMYGELRLKGLAAKVRLAEILKAASHVSVATSKAMPFSHRPSYDGFGRYLATVFADGVNVNQVLLDEGLATTYVSAKLKGVAV